ncbi:MAG TPA: carbohydrate ABC transporter permease [Gaiellaceae bacterium]|nr:carbohydrate ABC transporter permease [Gaiellaceae bacterium]
MSKPGTGSGLISELDWEKPRIRWGTRTLQALLLVGLVVIGLGPILWLAKSAITPTLDTITHPMALFPHGAAWSNLSQAWNDVHVGRYFWNTVVIAFGSWAAQIIVATTGGFALSVLRPRYAPIIKGLLLATLFVPVIVLLVPLYIEVVHLPIVHKSLIDSYWALWLPYSASAFNVILVTRFFDNLPREIFEAAEIDGAGPLQLFWRIVLPMSKPILGVVSVFAILASWKDFLWPSLVLSNPNRQPLGVRLPAIQLQTSVGVFLAAMFIACLVPIAGFLIFQRSFLGGTGLGGAIKG